MQCLFILIEKLSVLQAHSSLEAVDKATEQDKLNINFGLSV
jgi:hypothetical protein